MDTFKDILEKIDAADYNVQVLELLSVWRIIERETTRLYTDGEYMEQENSDKGKKYVEGYQTACKDWKAGIQEENKGIRYRILELMGLWHTYRQYPQAFEGPFKEYANKPVNDVDALFSDFKKNIREVYVPALKY